jgi:hypothetical protein
MDRLLDEPERDGRKMAELNTHMAGCRDCEQQWAVLSSIEALLGSQRLLDPPPNFSSRVVARIDNDARQAPPWRRSLLQISMILAGAGSFATATALFVHGFGSTLGATQGAKLALEFGIGAISILGALAGIVAASQHIWLAYSAMSVVLALAWFAALVLPRSANVLND